jgi:TRAP-type C4-dicarboxylate transport system permease small subunit
MSHGIKSPADNHPDELNNRTDWLGTALAIIHKLNHAMMIFGGMALLLACLVLTYSVIVRYALKVPTDWQDETAIFLLVGATFLSSAAVQARRGHIGIEALASILPAPINHIRLLLVDFLSFVFCAFFTWKSLTLFHEAWLDDQHSSSTWGPPLIIPYGLMTMGMALLTVQILLQALDGMFNKKD